MIKNNADLNNTTSSSSQAVAISADDLDHVTGAGNRPTTSAVNGIIGADAGGEPNIITGAGMGGGPHVITAPGPGGGPHIVGGGPGSGPH